MGEKPKIFAFCNGGSAGMYEGVAIAEDGNCLAMHACSSPAWVPHDLGVTSDRKHAEYKEHYPDGYEVVFVSDPATHEGLQAAYALNQKLAQEAAAC